MRPAAYCSATLIALGMYVAAAAVFAFPPAWIGLGVLGISAIAAVFFVAGDRKLPAR